jgi:hypothetical protein
LSKRESLLYGLLMIVELVLYWQGIVDVSHVFRVAVGLGIYVGGRLIMRSVKASERVKGVLEAVLLGLALIWILEASWTTALWVIGLIGIRLSCGKAKASR